MNVTQNYHQELQITLKLQFNSKLHLLIKLYSVFNKFKYAIEHSFNILTSYTFRLIYESFLSEIAPIYLGFEVLSVAAVVSQINYLMK